MEKVSDDPIILEEAENPVIEKKNSIDEGTVGPKVREYQRVFEEELEHVIKNRRKKKVLNKRIRSMTEIQICSLSLKERRKRDQALKREKVKRGAEVDDRVVNLSLSDSDISNRAKVVIKEAKNAWEVVKKIGFVIHGNEMKVVEDIMQLEER